MKTANKLTITLSPEEVKAAIEYYVWDHKGAGWKNAKFRVSMVMDWEDDDLGHPKPETIGFTGATVEVTHP